MQLAERGRLMELTSKAISINRELLKEEKCLLEAAEYLEPLPLKGVSDKINELIVNEHLHVAAIKSLLQIVTKGNK
jgi:hypothetical protein